MVAPGEHAADEMTEFGGILLPESERQAIYQNALAGGLSDYEAREKAWPSVSPDAERSEPSAFSGESVPPVIVTLADGTTLEAFEAEVEMAYEGSAYMGRDVPYITPVDWRLGFDQHKPTAVRLFAVVEHIGGSGADDE